MNTFSDCEIVAAEAVRSRFEAHMATDFTEERLSRIEGLFPHIREGVREGEFLETTTWVKSKRARRRLT